VRKLFKFKITQTNAWCRWSMFYKFVIHQEETTAHILILFHITNFHVLFWYIIKSRHISFYVKLMHKPLARKTIISLIFNNLLLTFSSPVYFDWCVMISFLFKPKHASWSRSIICLNYCCDWGFSLTKRKYRNLYKGNFNLISKKLLSLRWTGIHDDVSMS